MQIYINDQISYLIFSMLTGIVMGILYDIFNLVRLFFKNKLISFVFDTLFMLSYGFSLLVVTYSKNFGSYRWYAFLASALTLYLYRASIGKVITKIEKALIDLIANIIKYAWRNVRKVLDFFLKFVKIKLNKVRAEIYVKKLLSEARETYVRQEQYEKRSFKNRKAKT